PRGPHEIDGYLRALQGKPARLAQRVTGYQHALVAARALPCRTSRDQLGMRADIRWTIADRSGDSRRCEPDVLVKDANPQNLLAQILCEGQLHITRRGVLVFGGVTLH